MDGWTDRCMDRQIEGWKMYGLMKFDGYQMDCTDRCMDGQIE